MISTHVMAKPRIGVLSPLDATREGRSSNADWPPESGRSSPAAIRGVSASVLGDVGPSKLVLHRGDRGAAQAAGGRDAWTVGWRRVARDGKATTKSFREREVPTICVDTACYPASLVSPGKSASEDGRASATSIPLVGRVGIEPTTKGLW